MKEMTIHPTTDGFAGEEPPIPTEWQVTAFVVLVAGLCVIGLFWPTIGSMMEVWSNSRTFAHGFLVLPAAGYLIWCYRRRFVSLMPSPSLWGLGALVLSGAVWLLGYWTSLVVVQQAAVVAALSGLVWAVLGTTIFRILSWPLGFLVFLLPMGTSIEPWLQDFTAWFIRIGLKLTGIPFVYENHLLTISSGTWQVAPDCGGLRYLLPGLALGYAFATLIYERPVPRLVFLAVCAAMLMVANGVRAYGVIAGDHFGIAEGTDHRIFSYTIYGMTIPLLYWLGLKWADTRTIAWVPNRVPYARHDTGRTLFMAIVSVALLAVAPLSVWLWLGHP